MLPSLLITVVVLAAAAILAANRSRGTGKANAPVREVLILTTEKSTIFQSLLARKRLGREMKLTSGEQSMRVDIRTVEPGEGDFEVVKRLKETSLDHRAAYVTSIALARAMQLASPSTPLVFHGDSDPVLNCVTTSLSRPSQNATGYSNFLPLMDAKLLEVLVDAYPKLVTVVVAVDHQNFFDPNCDIAETTRPPRLPPPCLPGLHEPDADLERMQQTKLLRDEAVNRKVALKFFLFCTREDFNSIGKLYAGRQDIGFIFPLQSLFIHDAAVLVNAVNAARLPAVYGDYAFAQVGGLLAAEPIHEASPGDTSFTMLMQVLSGGAPSAMPIQMPHGIRITINVRTSRDLGMPVSLASLRRADELTSGAAR